MSCSSWKPQERGLLRPLHSAVRRSGWYDVVAPISQLYTGMDWRDRAALLVSGGALVLALGITTSYIQESWRLHFGGESVMPEKEVEASDPQLVKFARVTCSYSGRDKGVVSLEAGATCEVALLLSLHTSPLMQPFPLRVAHVNCRHSAQVVAEENDGWVLVKTRRGTQGYFPAAYLHLQAPELLPPLPPVPLSPMDK